MDYHCDTWQANRFALDDRSLSESLGSTGPGQYEADSDGIQMGFRWDSDGIQMGVDKDFPALSSHSWRILRGHRGLVNAGDFM